MTTVHSPYDIRIFHKQAKTLVKAGYDVVLIAQNDKDEVVNGVKIIALPKTSNRLTRIFLFTWRAFYLALRIRPNIYHFHDPELLHIGLLLKLLTRAKVVYDVHEDVPQQILNKHWIPPFLRWLTAWIFNRWEKFAARHLNAVVVATEGIADTFRKVRPIIIHNFPDLSMLPHSSPASIKVKEKRIVYIGGISKIRGATEMVHSLEYLKHIDGVRLDLIGRFEPLELRRELKRITGCQSVCFHGLLPWRKAWKIAKTAILGIILFHPVPNHERSLPNKLFEYMAVGIPVIASNFPLWKEIVEGNNCGLCVNPMNPKEIARAIEQLLMHPEESRRMGENGRRAVEEKYNWEREEKKLVKLYEELLNR
jgi:glycosyltransferase involved in cell wall biosynthesis